MGKLALIWKTKDLRNKILITIGLLILTRVLTYVPIPALSQISLKNFFSQNSFLGFLDIFSGGGLSTLSVAMVGVGPYITASIIVQLLTVIIPAWTELQKEGGEAGREKLNQYTRYLTIPLAMLQTYAYIKLIETGQRSVNISLPAFTPFQWFATLLAVTAGTMIMMWLGELITEYGIGNGISLIIFAGIVARLPQGIQQFASVYTSSQLDRTIFFVVVALLIITAVVVVTEAQRNIPVSYAKHVRGQKTFGGVNTHLPLRVNQSGVIPIIFALSILSFPALIASRFVNARTALIAHSATNIINFLNNQTYYPIFYFLLVVIFTYFYTTVVFNPDEIAENVQKNGGFIPGLRPGRQTAEYLYRVLNRITTFGALFLAVIAVLPFVLTRFTNSQTLSIGGTSLLIVVAVVIETIKAVEAQMVMHNYE